MSKLSPKPASEKDALPHAVRPAAPRRSGLIVLAATALGLALCAGIWPRLDAQAALTRQTAALAVPAVQVTQPSAAAATQELVLPADIEAERQTPIFARTDGYLKSWSVDIGTHVKAGQLLAVIDAPEVDDQLRQARADEQQALANSQLAQVTAQRWQQLLQTNSVSRQETDMKVSDAQAKQALLASTQANVGRLTQLQSYEKVCAPFDGVITARNTDVGALIQAGSAAGPVKELFDIATTSTLRVYVDVPQNDSAVSVDGIAAYLTLPQFPGRTFPGTIARNTGAINAVTRTLRVEVDIPNPGSTVLPGSYGQVHIALPTAHPGYALPVNTLLYRPQGVQVATVDPQGKVALKTLTLGRDFGTRIEVLTGLGPNDNVILNPSDSIAQGESVRVVTSAAS
jgi:membrane fusion protein (multidrug efflux system)